VEPENGFAAMGTALSKQGSTLAPLGNPDDPADWTEKHKVKAALAMFDAYDKNNDDTLDQAELRALFRDFAQELKLFFHVAGNISPSTAGIDQMVEALRRTVIPQSGPTLTFLEFLPLFMAFTDELISQAAQHAG
jgi:hypothetical protein